MTCFWVGQRHGTTFTCSRKSTADGEAKWNRAREGRGNNYWCFGVNVRRFGISIALSSTIVDGIFFSRE